MDDQSRIGRPLKDLSLSRFTSASAAGNNYLFNYSRENLGQTSQPHLTITP